VYVDVQYSTCTVLKCSAQYCKVRYMVDLRFETIHELTTSYKIKLVSLRAYV
jgi:hypothetical protein